MSVVKLNTPLSEEEVRNLNVGDTVYISGKMFTARDECHLKMLEMNEENESIPFNPEEMALFHCGPVVKKYDDEWKIISAGPTTSIRMEIFEDEFLKAFKTRMIIGKGGMADKTLNALNEVGAVYAHYTGGAGALAARAIKKVKDVYWLDELGIPEAAWILKIEEFGPLTITMDANNKSLYDDLSIEVEKNLESIYRTIEEGK